MLRESPQKTIRNCYAVKAYYEAQYIAVKVYFWIFLASIVDRWKSELILQWICEQVYFWILLQIFC